MTASPAVQRVLEKLDRVQRVGRGWRARCPAHADENPSLGIDEGEGRALLKCRSRGCSAEQIVSAIGLTLRDLFDHNEDRIAPREKGRTTIYSIRDADGRLVAEHVRTDLPDGSKTYSWRRNGTSGLKGLRTADLPLFGVDRLRPGPVVVTEGEKAQRALTMIGVNALGTVTGAASCPSAAVLEILRGRDVRLWPDADPQGVEHMRRIGGRLQGLAASVSFVQWAQAPPKGDAFDWLEAQPDSWERDLLREAFDALPLVGVLGDAHHTEDEPTAAQQPSLGTAGPVRTPAPDTQPVDGEGRPQPDLSHFNPGLLVPATVLVNDGRRIIADGVPYVVKGLIPAYGMAGFIVGYAKVGKSTFGIALAGAVSGGASEFLGLAVQRRRVLYLAVEDPREYIAWLFARAFRSDEDALVYPAPLILNDRTLADLEGYINDHDIGFVYVATFMAAARGLVRDENDNASMAATVEAIKQFARRIGKPVLLEAHSGKGEDSSADADPVRSLRGASAAAAAADFVLSLKRAGRGAFTTRRLLSGSGRFVDFSPITFDYDRETGKFSHIANAGCAAAETDWQLIVQTGALTTQPRSASAIARAAGFSDKGEDRQRVRRALENRPGVERVTKMSANGGDLSRYYLAEGGQPETG